jgi:L-aminopeptidase/D-esterase-like protein
MTFPVRGVRAGHWTGAHTGTTVILLPSGSIGSAEVRGGAPATREIALLDPACTVARVDALVLTGGSAYGLAAADGVMRFLAERGQGYATVAGPVPIVPAAAIFDLEHFDDERPNSDAGYAAAVAAERGGSPARGQAGAGQGATVGKWKGRSYACPGGFGLAHTVVGTACVAAVAVVNAIGDVVGPGGAVIAGSSAPDRAEAFPDPEPFGARENTTLVAVVTDAALDKTACHLLARSAHDGMARALRPAHTRFDGDVVFAAATGAVNGHLDRLREAAAHVSAEAIRDAVRPGPRDAVPG